MGSAPSRVDAFTTMLITSSRTGIEVCRLDILLDFINPQARGHCRLDEALFASTVAHAAATQFVLGRAVTVVWTTVPLKSMVVPMPMHRLQMMTLGSPQL
jgi:hypothetical protein